jgi:hypothetical protein
MGLPLFLEQPPAGKLDSDVPGILALSSTTMNGSSGQQWNNRIARRIAQVLPFLDAVEKA